MKHKLEDIKVWMKAIELSTSVYSLTSNFPNFEIYGLISQMRRSAVSIASNIAEGAGRGSNREFTHFLHIANGSSYELQTQVIISYNLSYITEVEKESVIIKINEIQKMIYGFIQNLNKSNV